jgi:hypothetical protein
MTAGCLVGLNLVLFKGNKSEQTPTRRDLDQSTILQGEAPFACGHIHKQLADRAECSTPCNN